MRLYTDCNVVDVSWDFAAVRKIVSNKGRLTVVVPSGGVRLVSAIFLTQITSKPMLTRQIYLHAVIQAGLEGGHPRSKKMELEAGQWERLAGNGPYLGRNILLRLPEDGDNTILLNTGSRLQDYTGSTR